MYEIKVSAFSLRSALCALALLASYTFAPLSAARAQETTTTTARPNNNSVQNEEIQRPALFITFIPKNPKPGITADANFGCSIPYPTVYTTISSRTASWSGGISCNATVGLYGTTVLFNYDTNVISAYGSQINTTSSSASSSGSRAGLSSGNYEVNFNVDITPPAGYTTTAGAGCYYINGGPRVHCTVGSGEFSLQ